VRVVYVVRVLCVVCVVYVVRVVCVVRDVCMCRLVGLQTGRKRPSKNNLIVLFVVGGVTFAEAAAVMELATSEGAQVLACLSSLSRCWRCCWWW